jgi:hypothetical protein
LLISSLICASRIISHSNFAKKILNTKQNVIIEDGNFEHCKNFIKVKLPDDHNYKKGEIIEMIIKEIVL